jgi:hypothetical protein
MRLSALQSAQLKIVTEAPGANRCPMYLYGCFICFPESLLVTRVAAISKRFASSASRKKGPVVSATPNANIAHGTQDTQEDAEMPLKAA